MRLIGCVRVSRVAGREGDSFISPDQQRDRIIQHAASQGHTVVGWQEDLDQPGSRMNRPGLEAALVAVERGEADGIAVAKLDRFARSVAGAAKTIERLEAAGGVLIAVDLGMDTSTPAGKLMRNVLMALAEFELDRISESWRDAAHRAVRRGVFVGPTVVFGYRRREDGRLEPDPETAAAATEAFRMRGAGQPWSAIRAMLDERAPRDGDRRWTAQTIGGMLESRTYLGETFNGPVTKTGSHEAIVTREEWERAQPTYPRPPARGGDALLAGIIRCAACSYTMTRAGDGARGYINYNCRRNHGAGRCPEPSRISTRRADEYVLGRFFSFAATLAAADSSLTVDTERAVSALEEADAELAAYRDDTRISVIGQHAYSEGLERRAARVDDARRQLAGIRGREIAMFGDVTVGDAWERMQPEQQRALLGAAIDAVFVRRAHLPGQSPFEHRIHICWRGEGPADLPGRRVQGVRTFVFPNDRPGTVGMEGAEDL